MEKKLSPEELPLQYATKIARKAKMRDPFTKKLFNAVIPIVIEQYKENMDPEQLLDLNNEESPLFPTLDKLSKKAKSRWIKLSSSYLAAQVESDISTEANT